MTVEQVIVNPESLQDVSQQFKRRAAVHEQNLTTIIGELNSLRSQGPEGWIGDAATQHFMEMEQYVIPGYKRLIEALNEAVAIMKFTQNEFHTADQEGSKAFKQLDSTGNAQVEKAMQQGGSGTPGSIDGGGAGQGSGSGGGPSGGGGGEPSGSGSGQQDTGSGGAQASGSKGSLGTGSGSGNDSTSGVRSGGAVSEAAGDGNNWMAGLAAVGGTVVGAAKLAKDKLKK